MSEEKTAYKYINLVDDIDKHLQEAFTLADLLTHYDPPGEGGVYGRTVENAGYMLQNTLIEVRGCFKKWEEQKRKSREAKDATSGAEASLPVH
jgi:hypothetical protein